MENNKKFLLIFISCIVVAIVLIALVFPINPKKENGITAIEGKEIADNVISEHYQNFTLVSVRANGDINSGGKSTKWLYSYRNLTNQTKEILIEVSKKSVNISEDFHPGPILYPLGNWQIDSNKAIEIAKDNNTIKEFLLKYGDAYLESIYITRGMNYSNPTIYSVRWHSSGINDDPHNARIIIDANTGEVLEVETQ